MPKLPRLNEIQRCHRFLPDLVERISAHQQIGEVMFNGVAGIDYLTGFPGGLARYVEVSESIVDRARPVKGHLRREVYRRLLSREPVTVSSRDGKLGKALAILEAMENRPQDEGQSRKSHHGGAADAMLQAQLCEPADHHLVEILIAE